MKHFLCLSLFIISSLGFAGDGPSNNLLELVSKLERLRMESMITFSQPADEIVYLDTLSQMRKVIEEVSQLENKASSEMKLDRTVKEAMAVQRLLSAYLGEKEFHGYKFNKGPISVNIDVIGNTVAAELSKRLKFLSVGNGRVRVNSTAQKVAQFNALKSEFATLLAYGAQLNNKDKRIKAMAEWGQDTDVIYPGETFGEEIITYSQLRDLKLED